MDKNMKKIFLSYFYLLIFYCNNQFYSRQIIQP